MTGTPTSDPPVWLVTGASSGFGRELAEEFMQPLAALVPGPRLHLP
jgi:NADP-dependent 3-hydroxy acid dehydrogenase YdfG